MNLDFDYKICNIKDYLSEDDFKSFSDKVKRFDVDLNEIKSTLGFLCWSNRVQEKVNQLDNLRFNNIIERQFITYDDFCFLSNLNKKHNFGDDDYFNFFLTYSNECFKKVGIYDFIKKSYVNIIYDLFKKNIKPEFEENLIGNINIYPKDSFIRKHRDNDPDGQRLFTILFFLNSDRTKEQGSLLKIFNQNGDIEIVPSHEYCVILEHQKYNLIHEVTLNLSDDVRYSIYSPFTIKDYEEKLIHN